MTENHFTGTECQLANKKCKYALARCELTATENTFTLNKCIFLYQNEKLRGENGECVLV